MKSFLKFSLAAIVGGILISLAIAQSPYYYTIIVRTFADIRGKAVVGDSLRVQGTTRFNGAVTAVSAVSDTSAFTAALLEKGIFISGATSTDKYVATPRALAVTLPVAGDLLACFAKTDSLVVLRAAGTTSGLKFSYMRVR